MMKPKEYLLSIGAIKEITRGRLTLENIEKCKAAAANGIAIEGYEVSKTAATSTAPATVTVEKRKPAKASDIMADIEMRYSEHEWIARVESTKAPVGMRTVCDNCGSSLVVHRCSSPRVMVKGESVAVEIVGKGASK